MTEWTHILEDGLDHGSTSTPAVHGMHNTHNCSLAVHAALANAGDVYEWKPPFASLCPLHSLPCPRDMRDRAQRAMNALMDLTEQAIIPPPNVQLPGEKTMEGGSFMDTASVLAVIQLASLPWVSTYCESGFNGGHSVLAALVGGNANITVASVGLYQHDFARNARDWIMDKYPDHAVLINGDIYRGLRSWDEVTEGRKVVCDVVFADAHAKVKHKKTWLGDELALWASSAVGDCTIGLAETKSKYSYAFDNMLAPVEGRPTPPDPHAPQSIQRLGMIDATMRSPIKWLLADVGYYPRYRGQNKEYARRRQKREHEHFGESTRMFLMHIKDTHKGSARGNTHNSTATNKL